MFVTGFLVVEQYFFHAILWCIWLGMHARIFMGQVLFLVHLGLNSSCCFCVLELKCYLTSLEAVAFVVRSQTIQCLNSKVLVWFSVIYENLGIPRSLLALCRFTRL